MKLNNQSYFEFIIYFFALPLMPNYGFHLAVIKHGTADRGLTAFTLCLFSLKHLKQGFVAGV